MHEERFKIAQRVFKEIEESTLPMSVYDVEQTVRRIFGYHYAEVEAVVSSMLDQGALKIIEVNEEFHCVIGDKNALYQETTLSLFEQLLLREMRDMTHKLEDIETALSTLNETIEEHE